MEQFQVEHNNFNGKIRTDFGRLQNLKKIGLFHNNFGSGEPDELAFIGSFANCSNLEILGMEVNQFRGVLPESVGNLSKNLFSFILSRNQTYGTIPSTIGNLVNLDALGMEGNQFTGTIPTNVGNLPKMQILDLGMNHLSGKILDSIGNLSLLIELYLEDNRLEGTIPSGLANYKKLLLLHLYQNNLSGNISKELLKVSSLSISLNLAWNHLSGSLPTEVGNLKNLMELDISENKLSGEIPSSLGSCTSLENLYMQENSFQGSISLSLESLRGIQNFDLSHNNLSGKILTFLEKFSLMILNLSFNDFEGELPMEGVFANASAISIVGNHGLCGGISELQLLSCITKKSKHKMPISHILAITTAFVLVGATLLSFFAIYLFKKQRTTQSTVPVLKESFLKVSYEKLLKETDGFSPPNLIGFGSFGSVYRGILIQDREFVAAIKVLNLQNRVAIKSFRAECETLRNIQHRNLVRIITSCSGVDFQGNDFKALVYEFMPNGSLERWLHASLETNDGQNEQQGLNLLQRINISIDVTCAFDYLC
ncbi:receptor kinase-like protein Xa21 [Camellia sinensis]|uniref:receptor kinase-like protein Xa21 n=1 Tax=Camellia sinensis TaxID=4442 RepID=UPI001035998F|nr:receptor kinase-like protein Xa21 [Camellia sinensis]